MLDDDCNDVFEFVFHEKKPAKVFWIRAFLVSGSTGGSAMLDDCDVRYVMNPANVFCFGSNLRLTIASKGFEHKWLSI